MLVFIINFLSKKIIYKMGCITSKPENIEYQYILAYRFQMVKQV